MRIPAGAIGDTAATRPGGTRAIRNSDRESWLMTTSRRASDQVLGRHPEDLVRALLTGPGTHHLVDVRMVDEVLDELRYPLVRIGHVGVGPHDYPAPGLGGTDPPGRPRSTVTTERHQAHVWVVRQLLAQHGEGVIGRLVIDDEQFVAEIACVQCLRDALELVANVILFVVAG